MADVPMIDLQPMTDEEIFKHKLKEAKEREGLIRPLFDFQKNTFDLLQDTQPGEARSLLMKQLRESFLPNPGFGGKTPEGFDAGVIRPQDYLSDPRSSNSVDRNHIVEVLKRRLQNI